MVKRKKKLYTIINTNSVNINNGINNNNNNIDINNGINISNNNVSTNNKQSTIIKGPIIYSDSLVWSK